MSSTPSEPRQRLFFALWPDDRVRQAIDATSLVLLGKRLRRVPAANLHLTLAFAGFVDQSMRECLEKAASGIEAEPFSLTIDHPGHWPRPRVFWIGPSDLPPPLWSLVGQLRTAFEACGLEPERRPWEAHVTLARKLARPPEPKNFTPLVWSIGEFCLVESVPSDNGVLYRVLRRWALGSG